MAKVIIGIGIPGSGKTTFLKSFANKNSYEYICPDDIRAELLGKAADQSRMREIWEEAYKRLKNALQGDKTVVFDATNAKEVDRKGLVSFSREIGAEKIQGVYAEVPLEVALERNNARDRVVPPFAMERMRDFLHKAPPILGEGFDSIFYLNEFQELQKVESNEQSPIMKEFKPKLM
jgi:predicted kinase